jgi:hypothetical protein
MNVYGGEMPNGEFTPLLQAYARECKYYLDGKIDAPAWLNNLKRKYELPDGLFKSNRAIYRSKRQKRQTNL